ncbi:tRNA (adenosine(37)-N6)-threonylcarbamoyltransferase complex dimerization subunit type 1 TsaB [Effusibacillus pohliae]|uniref:tRNA (adenosine(37)-N6)-threonylcarbamoyltransferase complex dimerization subunit type 1 TsaB n=1 Tax=Effusibacillus pohliae TaxID=232270 RepID=UPI000374033D|nr:tRNA (adenosine(37)-N6)-threonylcarbamoyltransferase complex dimerization subunit type 1 TsaB [Effusibacillus pohliae]
MPYLAVDTATQTLTVAIGERDRLLAEASVVVKKNHSNRLMPLIESLLVSADLTPEDLKGIVVGHGPGSYTGVRIGVTTGKMLAWALKIPIVGVSSLDGLAMHYRDADCLVCPLFDARRKQAYCAVYGRREVPRDGGGDVAADGQAIFAKMEPDAIRKLEDLFPLLERRLAERESIGSSRRVLFLGDGADHYRDLIVDRFGQQACFPASGARKLVRAAHLLEAGIRRIEAGDTAVAERFAPQYLQLVEAEAKLLGMQTSDACGKDGAC